MTEQEDISGSVLLWETRQSNSKELLGMMMDLKVSSSQQR